MTQEQITTPDEEKKQGFLSKIGWPSKVLILVLGAMFWYAVSTTTLVQNTTYTNTTDLSHNVKITTPHIRYTDKDLVPKDTITPTYALFETILFLLIVYMLVKVDNKPTDFITIREARAIVEREIKLDQIINRLPRGDYFIERNFKLVNVQKVPFKYVMDVLIKNEEKNLRQLYRAEVNAKTRFFMGFISAKKPLSREDTCGRCGHDSDVRVIVADTFKDFRRIKQEMGLR